jgi:murein DD-endopeptidase MepM/ murein hydrolase activator NlpD
MKILKPFKGDFALTQKFGVPNVINGKKGIHQGTDWALPKDTQVLSAIDGFVYRVEPFRLDGYGKSIYMRTQDGQFSTLHAHLNSLLVKVNDKISKGTVIGRSGRTGYCIGKTGYHLHFGLMKGADWVNCEPYLEDPATPQLGMTLPEPTIKRIYIVKRGDTLSGIAYRYYNNASMWRDIYEANKKTMLDPNKIFAGQHLIIPNLD